MVRNGFHDPREVATAAGAVPVPQPRVNDKRIDEACGQRKRFTWAILPARASENERVDWPLNFGEIGDDALSLRPYTADDASALFIALEDERAWEHIPRAIPVDAAALDAMIQVKVAQGLRATFVIWRGNRVVGMTSVLFDPADPDGVEVGGTQIDPRDWGTGVNQRAKQLLFAVLFAQGAQWIQLRTDIRNERSAAAIRKLGARDLGVHQDHRVRRDGTQRQSLLFRVDRRPD